MQGSMGHASSVALGVALSLPPHNRVIVLDGDGATLMHMGELSTIGNVGPRNLVHIVLDNEGYGSTGDQATTSRTTLLHDVAAACRYRNATVCATAAALRDAISWCAEAGPTFILCKTNSIYSDPLPRVTTRYTPAQNLRQVRALARASRTTPAAAALEFGGLSDACRAQDDLRQPRPDLRAPDLEPELAPHQAGRRRHRCADVHRMAAARGCDSDRIGAAAARPVRCGGARRSCTPCCRRAAADGRRARPLLCRAPIASGRSRGVSVLHDAALAVSARIRRRRWRIHLAWRRCHRIGDAGLVSAAARLRRAVARSGPARVVHHAGRRAVLGWRRPSLPCSHLPNGFVEPDRLAIADVRCLSDGSEPVHPQAAGRPPSHQLSSP